MNKIEVTNILESWLDGTLDSHEWDNFLSVKNRNTELEEIRDRAEYMWQQNSVFLLPGAINPCLLSAKGREEVVKLLAQCRGLKLNA